MSRSTVMLAILAAVAVIVVLLLWRAQRDQMKAFNVFDLIMENGRVSKIAFSYMVVLAVTTWTEVYLTIQGKMTEGLFLAYGAMWVAPLVAKIVFNKTEPPANTTVTTLTQQTTEVTPP